MENLALSQAYSLYIYILSGILIGIFFDIFRVLRKSFKTSDIITQFEDILFWLFTGSFLLYVIFKFNNGEMRAFIFLGIIVGVFIYMKIFSKYFIKVSVKIIDILKKIIIFPLKLIRKIFLKPISFVFINITKTVKKSFNFISKIMHKLNFFKKAPKKATK